MNIWRFNRKSTLTGAFSFSALFLFLFLGCASDKPPVLSISERSASTSPEPPPVFNLAVITLLTNQPPFGAHCRIIRGQPNDPRPPLEGEFLHRANQFLFAAKAQDKRARGLEMTFVWDFAKNGGFVMNDALPGYAPLVASTYVTNMEQNARSFSGEKIDGHLCKEEQVGITLNDGSVSQITVWRATDMNDFPMRVRCTGPGPRYTVEFSNVRRQEPSPTLFEIPSDFTKYATPASLFDEILNRESATQRGRKPETPFDEEGFKPGGPERRNI